MSQSHRISQWIWPSFPEGVVGIIGTVPRSHWVIWPSKSNPEYWLPSREVMATIFTVFDVTWLEVEPTTYQHPHFIDTQEKNSLQWLSSSTACLHLWTLMWSPSSGECMWRKHGSPLISVFMAWQVLFPCPISFLIQHLRPSSSVARQHLAWWLTWGCQTRQGQRRLCTNLLTHADSPEVWPTCRVDSWAIPTNRW